MSKNYLLSTGTGQTRKSHRGFFSLREWPEPEVYLLLKPSPEGEGGGGGGGKNFLTLISGSSERTNCYSTYTSAVRVRSKKCNCTFKRKKENSFVAFFKTLSHVSFSSGVARGVTNSLPL